MRRDDAANEEKSGGAGGGGPGRRGRGGKGANDAESVWCAGHVGDGEKGGGAGVGGSRKESLERCCGDRRPKREPGVLRENGCDTVGQRDDCGGQGTHGGPLQAADES